MDGTRFDAFTRTLASRRTALGGLLGGVTALLGLALPDAADAHNFRARCGKIQDPPRRRACIRRARAHNRAHARSRLAVPAPPAPLVPPPCQPLPPAVACVGISCGQAADGCGGLVPCSCPEGESCLTWPLPYFATCCPSGQACSAFPRTPPFCCPAGTVCINPYRGGHCACRPEQICDGPNSNNGCCEPPNTCVNGECTPP